MNGKEEKCWWGLRERREKWEGEEKCKFGEVHDLLQ